jgi:enoyl-CoA hydratase/carnithine racemase
MTLDVRFAARGQAGIGQTEVLMGIVPGGGATPTYPA